jgi:hypothetical protein
MKQAFKERVWPVTAGLFSAFLIMMLFEYVNSHFYPLPVDLDWRDSNAVALFTDSLPWTAYILVISGWITGSYAAGYITTRLARERAYILTLITGGILTFMGLLNNMMLAHSIAFNVVTLPLFGACTYFGYLHSARRNVLPADSVAQQIT